MKEKEISPDEELEESEASNLSHIEFRVMIFNSIKKDMETIKKHQSEIKSAISEINNILEGINNRLHEAED